MKKILLLAFVTVFMTFGCGGKDDKKRGAIVSQCLAGAPEWVLAGGTGSGVTSVGAARMTPAGMQFARTAALGNARDEMARNISVKVNNMLKDFTQTTGIGDDVVVDTVTASVSKQVASQTLTGTMQRAIWESNCGELYVLIEANPSLVMGEISQGVRSSYQNDNALWQQFQAQKAQDELDAAIMKEFGY